MYLPWQLLLLLLLVPRVLPAATQQSESTPGDNRAQILLEAGKQIYLYGILPEGESLNAKVRGDVTLQGNQYACAKCHRRSGAGSSEGGDQVPAITGEVLFSPFVTTLHNTYPTGGLHKETRPAYTTESLGRVLREGIDSAGRQLSPLMPRFTLTDSEVLALSTYLANLNLSIPPGIDAQEIHFATITTPGNDAARDAMFDVFNTFFRIKNAGTRNEGKRAQNAPYHKAWVYEAYRRWKLHEWSLQGPEKDWPAQLHNFYEKQPVFAIIGGVGTGDWNPVHRFCEEQQIPCLMPHIPSPPSGADDDFYSVYFSRGVALEAMALAKHLSAKAPQTKQVVQIWDKNAATQSAAQVLRQELNKQKAINLVEIELKSDQPPGADFWAKLAGNYGEAEWVIWLGAKKLQGLSALANREPIPSAIYLSASLQRDIRDLQQHPLHTHFTLLTPYRAADNEKNTLRFLTWAHIRQLHISNLHLQSSSFLVATLVGETLTHMRSNFSREYFLERIEHSVDNLINTSLYPRISLAPGQRFAAKGCYVWEMEKKFETAKWIVP